MSNIDIHVRNIVIEGLYKNNYDPERFFGYCESCANFNRLYSCPPFAEDMDRYLEVYPYITLIAIQLFYTEDEIRKYYGEEECMAYTRQTLTPISSKLRRVLLVLEDIYPNTISLGSGGCDICTDCSRVEGKPCRYPNKMRTSPEALGFDVTAILKEYFNIDIYWSKDTLPRYYTLMGALCSMKQLDISSYEIAQLFLKDY